MTPSSMRRSNGREFRSREANAWRDLWHSEREIFLEGLTARDALNCVLADIVDFHRFYIVRPFAILPKSGAHLGAWFRNKAHRWGLFPLMDDTEGYPGFLTQMQAHQSAVGFHAPGP